MIGTSARWREVVPGHPAVREIPKPHVRIAAVVRADDAGQDDDGASRLRGHSGTEGGRRQGRLVGVVTPRSSDGNTSGPARKRGTAPRRSRTLRRRRRDAPHRAARDGHAEVLHAFLLHGADANARDEDGNTPSTGGLLRPRALRLGAFGRRRAGPRRDERRGQHGARRGVPDAWQRPPEHAVRAVSTLAQCAGAAASARARGRSTTS